MAGAPPEPPQLNGAHFKITAVPENRGFVNYHEENNSFGGYLVEVMHALAKPERCNFTFDLFTPSGFGSLCRTGGGIQDDREEVVEPYESKFLKHYHCGQSDVTDLPFTNYTTDFYLGLFYVTNERQLLNQFTIPIIPPMTGTLTMVGTATRVLSIPDFVEQQQLGRQLPACVLENTAYPDFLRRAYPSIQLVEVAGSFDVWNIALENRECDVVIVDHPIATSFVLYRFEQNSCTTNGKPVGIIGYPLGYGPNFYSIGVRKDISKDVVSSLDFWLNHLMSCSPTDECPSDSLSVLYEGKGGTGRECGYRNYPPINTGLDPPILVGIVVGSVLFVAIVSFIVYRFKLLRQENRYKKRFVQQIARNISIGPSPSCISVEKLAEEVQHIGNSEGIIKKEELLKWINDVKLEFISDRDFDALWAAMDIDNNGEVNAIDFFVFLSACGEQFEEVYEEQRRMPKLERLKLAARRLSNINKLGEVGVRDIERKLERNNITPQPPAPS